MKNYMIMAFVGAGLASIPVATAKTLAESLKMSYQIDDLLEAEYKKMEMKPNAIVEDGVFVRRSFLNITGRIPTADEAREFIDNKQPGKRVKLIDQLIESDGFKGKIFLFYSELLRLQTYEESHGIGLHEFLYQAAKQNRPYNKVVFDLLSAEGHVAENPAVGYYLRDAGMTLDNVSNTVQVFLGTQIGCAQCHDHPFEDTTQMDFYKVAAFSGGFDFKSNPDVRKMLREVGIQAAKADGVDIEAIKKRAAGRTKNEKVKARAQARAVQNLAKKYAREAAVVFKYQRRNHFYDNPGKELKLPHDYQYNDGKPEQVVKPGVIFGDMPKMDGNTGRREAFATWVTAPNNPQFTKVIANRLWAHAFGYGLAEPLDNWTDRTEVSHEKVLTLLESEMKSNGYNIKETLRTLYLTTLFQRKVSPIEVAGGKTYHFAGPMLRRMKGEELYDSMLTLEKGPLESKVNQQRVNAWETVVSGYKQMKQLSAKELLSVGRTITIAEKASDAAKRKARELKAALLKAKGDGDMKLAAKLQKELGSQYGKARMQSQNAVMNMTEMNMKDGGANASSVVKYAMSRNVRFRTRGVLRAYEHAQPFKAGTFVREFGSTDGETSNNSSNHASVPQALSMLNGREILMVTDKNGALPDALKKAKTPEERLNTLFLAIYSRYPTEKETARFKSYTSDLKQIGVLAKAMINSKSFLFIQ